MAADIAGAQTSARCATPEVPRAASSYTTAGDAAPSAPFLDKPNGLSVLLPLHGQPLVQFQ